MRKLSNLIRDYPNYIIFAIGVIGFVIFYLAARSQTGLNSDLLVNLAASSLIIAVTVLVVDALREKHHRLNVRGAAVSGITKIQMANFGVITMLGNHHFHDLKVLQDEHLKNLLKKSARKKSYMDDYLVRLLATDHEKLLDGLSATELRKLRDILASSVDTSATVIDTYAYAFDNKLREHLLSFRETVYYSAYSLADVQLAASGGLVRASQMMSIVLEKFQEFQRMAKRV